ncbi:MAG TPA: hypothetical protein VM262_07255 [Acidimicrobiales bacterium]|nr:hypothetical protein [Acidimicrobiales bacterium]
MTEHEIDFTDCDTVRVTFTHGRVGITGYHRGGATESVSVDLPTAGVAWHDERILAPSSIPGLAPEEAIALALITGGDPYIVRRQVERLERLLPEVAWSAHMVRAIGSSIATRPYRSDRGCARRGRDTSSRPACSGSVLGIVSLGACGRAGPRGCWSSR